jgi:two-component system chemotaxis response regulator CheY
MAEQKFRVLIIEDSPTDRQVLTYLLTKRLNCEVETAIDGAEGLKKLSNQCYSVVFLDMLLPKMDGDTVLANIRSRTEIAHVPVVITSANGDPQFIRSVLKMGVYDYILKPYNKVSTIERLAATFERLKTGMKKCGADD